MEEKKIDQNTNKELRIKVRDIAIAAGLTGLALGTLSVMLYLSIKKGNIQGLEIKTLTEQLKLSHETNQKLFEQGTRLMKENKKLASDGLKKGSSVAGKVMQGYKAVG